MFNFEAITEYPEILADLIKLYLRLEIMKEINNSRYCESKSLKYKSEDFEKLLKELK